jgi:hypothetical protein
LLTQSVDKLVRIVNEPAVSVVFPNVFKPLAEVKNGNVHVNPVLDLLECLIQIVKSPNLLNELVD